MGDIIRRNAHNYPDKIALIDVSSGSRLTFREWNKRTNQAAHMIRALGVCKEDKVATWCFNGPEYLETRFATGKIGAAIVPINFRLAARELGYIADHSDAKILIFDQTLTEKVDLVRTELKKIKHFIIIGNDKPPHWAQRYEDIITVRSENEPEVDVFPEDAEALIYTSGTTGLPKGVVRTHANTVWNAINHFFLVDEGVPRDSIWINVMPLFHLGTFDCGFLPIMMIAGTNILMREFDPDTVMKIVEKEKATGFFLVPAAIAAIVDCQEKKQYDASSLRYAYSAAAPLPHAVKEKAEKIFESMDLYVLYGSSEFGLSNGISPTKKMDFMNVPCIGGGGIVADVRLLKQDGTDVTPSDDPEGEIGEIAVKGPIVLSEYYKNPETTETIFTHDGYGLTGDLGRIDTFGNLYITGRSKEMIISGGENIYPAEIENILFKHPAVADATAIGVSHEKWGETPRAIIVLRPGKETSEEEIITFCKTHLAGYKCPTSVVFVDSIPRSSAGKVQKHKLKEIFDK
jgi:acyl-CoA synthetase (AMP-forming)/AMP-acid ligase II